MLRLDNPVRDYAWGTPHGIPELLGREPDGSPAAELWIGAHPSAPSQTPDGPLDAIISEAPESSLGKASATVFGPRLPFLLKVLSAGRALSIQVHPSIEQARAGWAAEDAVGIALDAPERSYRDRNHKPELICALGDFEALSGFRPVAAVRATIARLRELASPADSALLDAWDEALSAAEAPAALAAAVKLLLGEWAVYGALADALAASVRAGQSSAADEDASLQASAIDPLLTLIEVNADYPGDPGALVALMLCRVHLSAGEGLYQDAGVLHAYLRGMGVEVMASSDNVLRGGLSDKHIDVKEMSQITQHRVAQPHVLQADRRGFYATPARDFTLQRITSATDCALSRCGAAAVLCVEGSFTLRSEAGDVELTAGQSVFVPAADPAITVNGQGQLFVATTGLCE